MKNILEISNLSKNYEGDGAIIHNMNLTVAEHEFLCILGPSGCGKSTLLRCIAGFEKYNGTIMVDGTAKTSPGIDRMMVFQDFNQLFPWKTVMQNIEYPLKKQGIKNKNVRKGLAQEALKKVNLEEYGAYYPRQLSGGMKQRAAIAKALVLKSRIILMDEPFAALDAITRDSLQNEIHNIFEREKCTVLFVTHNVQEALTLGTRIIVLSESGEIILDEENMIRHPVTPASVGYGEAWARLNEALYHGSKRGNKMNKYDDRYDIRLAEASDIESIMEFIDAHWKKGHIMSQDRELFEYEFREGDKVNVLIAVDKKTHLIEAMSGFLKASDGSRADKLDIWGSIWKVNSDTKNMTFLGVEIVKRIQELTNCRNYLGIGINPNTTLPIRKGIFKEKTGRMQHFYRLNKNADKFKIAVIENRVIPSVGDLRYKAVPLQSIEEVNACFTFDQDAIPYKDSWYVEKRYFKHPRHRYLVQGIKKDDSSIVEAVIVMRAQEREDAKILRIIDYFGDQRMFEGLGSHFDETMERENYEYVDFYALGFHNSYILNAGFVEKTDDQNIIPNYFGPFVQSNIDIWVRYNIDGTCFFKGDGDQDRPSYVRR